MLENKFKVAAQAIIRNNTLLVCSGSGMTADCSVPYFETSVDEKPKIPIIRGTVGLWKHFPAFRKQMLTYENLIEASFFKNYPDEFWYVFGQLYNKLIWAKPHEGYKKLD